MITPKSECGNDKPRWSAPKCDSMYSICTQYGRNMSDGGRLTTYVTSRYDDALGNVVLAIQNQQDGKGRLSGRSTFFKKWGKRGRLMVKVRSFIFPFLGGMGHIHIVKYCLSKYFIKRFFPKVDILQRSTA